MRSMRGGNCEGDEVMVLKCHPIPTLALYSASSVPLPLKGRECLMNCAH